MSFDQLVAACLMVHLLSPAVRAQLDEVSEPAQEVQLEIDGRIVPLTFDAPTQIEVSGKSVPVTLKQSDARALNLQHISVRYPAYFKYSMSRSRKSGDPVRWELEGHEIELTIFRQPADKLRYKDAERPLSDWFSTILGQVALERTSPVLTINQIDLTGTGYSIAITSGTLKAKTFIDVYEVPGNFGNFRYFLLLAGWDGDAPEEESLMRRLLAESFTIREEPLSPEWRVDYETRDIEK
jgi:hypothetical protein